MDFLEVMHTYFRGEKLEAALFIAPTGLFFLALAVGAWRAEQGGYMWGVVVTSVIFGLLLLGAGIGVAARTPSQVATIERTWQQDPAAMVREELPRMQKVKVLFSRTVPAFGILVLVGLGLHYGLRTDWSLAVGAVLVAAGGAGLLIDGFASRRVEPYLAALEALAHEHNIPTDPAAPQAEPSPPSP